MGFRARATNLETGRYAPRAVSPLGLVVCIIFDRAGGISSVCERTLGSPDRESGDGKLRPSRLLRFARSWREPRRSEARGFLHRDLGPRAQGAAEREIPEGPFAGDVVAGPRATPNALARKSDRETDRIYDAPPKRGVWSHRGGFGKPDDGGGVARPIGWTGGNGIAGGRSLGRGRCCTRVAGDRNAQPGRPDRHGISSPAARSGRQRIPDRCRCLHTGTVWTRKRHTIDGVVRRGGTVGHTRKWPTCALYVTHRRKMPAIGPWFRELPNATWSWTRS